MDRQQANEYATIEDFHKVFVEDLKGLYQLSLLLTGSHEKAERCFVAGLEECVNANGVFRGWAHTWAKCAIIQNAIHELKPAPSIASSFSLTFPCCIDQLPSDGGRNSELHAVLALEDFERFVFVMSVLECYSKHDCALLLGCTRAHIEEARTRAFAQLTGSRGIAVSDEIHLEEVQELIR
jgi:hypothetical protein